MWDENLTPLMDVLPVGVLSLDGENRLTAANEAGLRFLGLDHEAVGQDDFTALVDNANLKKALEAPANGVVRIAFPNGGRTFHAEVRSDPRGNDGAKVCVLKDVTGVSNMAILRRHFVFDLLHKVRTPLTTILSVLSMATGGRLDPTQVDMSEVLGMGTKQAERLTGLLTRLKDLFLLETGSLAEELSLRPISVSAVVAEAVRGARPHAGEGGQDIVEEYAPEAVTAMADAEALGRVVEMVLANATGFTPDSGEIRVSVANDEGGPRIRVADTGPGIPAGDLPEIFQRFRRGGSEEIQAVEGEGLGLFLSRQMLALMGGTILVDSEFGQGTVAEITLKAAEGDA